MARWLQPSRARESDAFGSNVPSQMPDTCQDGAVDNRWQSRDLTTSLLKALSKSCRVGYSDHNALYARLWRSANFMLVPAISHLFWDQFTRRSRKLKICTVRNASSSGRGPSGMLNWPDVLGSLILGRHAASASAGSQTLARKDWSKGCILRETMRPLQPL